MKIKILKSSFGFEEGSIYSATLQEGGYWAMNGTLGKFIKQEDAEIYEED